VIKLAKTGIVTGGIILSGLSSAYVFNGVAHGEWDPTSLITQTQHNSEQLANHEARISNNENDIKALQSATNTAPAANPTPVPTVITKTVTVQVPVPVVQAPPVATQVATPVVAPVVTPPTVQPPYGKAACPNTWVPPVIPDPGSYGGVVLGYCAN
jgi:hypothetical protein